MKEKLMAKMVGNMLHQLEAKLRPWVQDIPDVDRVVIHTKEKVLVIESPKVVQFIKKSSAWDNTLSVTGFDGFKEAPRER